MSSLLQAIILINAAAVPPGVLLPEPAASRQQKAWTVSSIVGRIAITGRLTNEGVECPAVRADDGQLYTLHIDDLRGLKAGDRVYVEGTKADMSHCMQGITLDVRLIRRTK